MLNFILGLATGTVLYTLFIVGIYKMTNKVDKHYLDLEDKLLKK